MGWQGETCRDWRRKRALSVRWHEKFSEMVRRKVERGDAGKRAEHDF